MMKKIITLLCLASVFISCDYDDYEYERTTDFSEDISNKRNFYLSTPIALTLLDSKIVNDTAYYKVGDTLKLSLKLNSIYQENTTDSYDLLKSTDSDIFEYSIYLSSEVDPKIVDLNILEKYPELNSGELSEEEIQTSPYYKDLYLDNYKLNAILNNETNYYESKIGLVLSEPTKFYDTVHFPLDLSVDSYITNNNSNGISIHIPIFSTINNSVIYVTN